MRRKRRRDANVFTPLSVDLPAFTLCPCSSGPQHSAGGSSTPEISRDQRRQVRTRGIGAPGPCLEPAQIAKRPSGRLVQSFLRSHQLSPQDRPHQHLEDGSCTLDNEGERDAQIVVRCERISLLDGRSNVPEAGCGGAARGGMGGELPGAKTNITVVHRPPRAPPST